MRRRVPTAVCALAAVAWLGACDAEPGRVSWIIELDPAVERTAVSSIEAWIGRDGCERSTAVFTTSGRPGGMAAIAPDPLSEGRWGFAAAALDGECRVIAEGCTVVPLPADGDRTVTTIVERLSVPRDACPDRCVRGVCAPPPDAGIDGGVDAGQDVPDSAVQDAARDAGAPDAGSDAGWDACVRMTEVCDNGGDDDCDGLADCDDASCASLPECGPCGGRCSTCETCVGTTCEPLADGTSCNGGAGRCGMGLCCEGCWTTTGACATGSLLQCGVGGVDCVECTGGDTCVAGTCG